MGAIIMLVAYMWAAHANAHRPAAVGGDGSGVVITYYGGSGCGYGGSNSSEAHREVQRRIWNETMGKPKPGASPCPLNADGYAICPE